jgi:hypothetical protein
VFSTSRTAAKARHLAARPAASVAHLRGEDLGVFAHGIAEELNPRGGPDAPDLPATLDHLTRHYGESPLNWGDVVLYRLRPHWMTVFAMNPGRLLGDQPG